MRTPLAILALLVLTPLRASAASPINFSRDIQPILSDNCYFCHGPDAHERHGDLRLDTIADPKLNPFAPRDGYNIITPGKPDDSVLVLRITSDDPDDLMPPAKSHRKLTNAQKQLLTEWIQQGAKWGKHWSFEPPVLSPVPEVKQKDWPRNPVDNFILARLEKENLHPSPEAPKTTLIRRVTLDLTGLPPTPAEIDAFLADTSPDAYDKVVDRLLASPRYGERMVWEWLDACRYADTNGYQADPTRTVWPWRDWVVRSMNANMPFDQFLTWQLAGDLLPNPTLDQRLASSFNRQNPFNGEGGRIPEETRVENVLDRTDTVGTIFLGLTVGCAKCHDHKFDPISQKDYYSLSAFFNQSSETGGFQYVNGGNVLPVMDYATPEESTKSAELKKISDEAQAKLKAANPALNAAQSKWEKSLPSPLATSNSQPATPSSATSANGASMQILDADHSILVSGKSPDNDTYTLTIPANIPTITGLKLEVLPDISLPHSGPGRSPDSGNFVLTNLELFSIPSADPTHSAKANFAYAFSTYDQGGLPASAAIDADPVNTGWAVFQAPDKNNISASFALAQPLTLSPNSDLRLLLHFNWKNNKEHTLGRFRVSFTTGPVLPPAVVAALNVPPSKRGKREEKKTLSDFYRTYISTEYPPLASAAAAAMKASKDFDATVTKVMVMNDAMPRQTYVLIKGGYDNHSTPVPTAIPAVFATPVPPAAPPASQPSSIPQSEIRNPQLNRLDLAHFLTSPTNPLTARVTVNRYWQQFFGIGLVKTSEDFGLQGEPPSNQPLLDYLAVDFRTHNWDVKRIQRLLVTSATYRQSSKTSAELQERDPEDRLLERAPRFRLPSVILRDQALAASGLLVEKIGGPPVNPYQPPGIWEEATFNEIKFVQDHGPSLYRRGLYTFWRRIVGPTEFFDSASRSTCVVRPSHTNTPLHALTTLNDPTFIEAARALAQRVLESPAATPADRIAYAYKLLLARPPTDKELSVLLPSLQSLTTHYTQHQPDALKLLSIGESKRNEKLSPPTHAAYTTLCLTLLNLDETLTKE